MAPILRFLILALMVVSVLGACQSVSTVKQSSNAQYASEFDPTDRIIGPYDLDALTTAPQRNLVLVHFDGGPSEIFMALLSEVDKYDETITNVAFDHSQSITPGDMNVGSVRICTFESGKQLYEPLVAYERDNYYAYTVDETRSTRRLPIKDIVLFYAFEEKADGSSLVTVRAHYNSSNRLLAPIIRTAFGRALNKIFASAAEVFGGRVIQPGA